MKAEFFDNCVNWQNNDVHSPGGLCDLISDCREITRRTFCRHVNQISREQVEAELGYAPHCPDSVLTMKRDYHVSYHRSKLHGNTVYLFKWSAIEYVFTIGGVDGRRAV
jgi:hypothetical protein